MIGQLEIIRMWKFLQNLLKLFGMDLLKTGGVELQKDIYRTSLTYSSMVKMHSSIIS